MNIKLKKRNCQDSETESKQQQQQKKNQQKLAKAAIGKLERKFARQSSQRPLQSPAFM